MTVAGLPAHPLVVHFAVVLSVLTAVFALVGLWPRLRDWAVHAHPLLAISAVVVSLAATLTGENLAETKGIEKAIHEHEEAGEMVRNLVILLALVACAQWVQRHPGLSAKLPEALRGPKVATALAVVGALVAVGVLVYVTLAGHSGAESVWKDELKPS